ncbi:hypothetical protein RISK_004981 [Rhodopirellula islandica]|uniref:Uncharacterized protein n=1 Tax=Rhodopirellula islandica TaxID=595434 RepID=A0A0J1B980_RHOIS|nr:hypothetical protein RISK_004981 [Rhodopirellula islandica]
MPPPPFANPRLRVVVAFMPETLALGAMKLGCTVGRSFEFGQTC